MQRFAIVTDISSEGVLLVPPELSMVEVFGFGFTSHPVRNLAEDALHHGEVFAIVVRLEQSDAQVQFEHNAADRPHVTRL